MAKKPSGYIIYRGPSLLDGQPIVVVAITKESKNSKTGNMIQTYVLVDNGELPIANYKSLADESICGDCKHRRGKGGACYVNVGQGPTMVNKGIFRGIYPEDSAAAAKASTGRAVRLGTYGDPAAVPAYVWQSLLAGAVSHTGYTHQWQSGKAEHVKEWCMASADSEQERAAAKESGWRTFRVRSNEEDVLKGEFVCPASEEGKKRLLCVDCTACSGGFNPRKGDPVIIVHGTLKNRFRKFALAVA
jgi:hypothetical protein